MLWLLLIAVSLAEDKAYFPHLCKPLPEELMTCPGVPLSLYAVAVDPENENLVCSATTSPEKCYFDVVSSDGMVSIDNSTGEVTFSPSEDTPPGIYSYKVIVYDLNVNSDSSGVAGTEFSYFNMANWEVFEFTVTDLSKFPNLNEQNIQNYLESEEVICSAPYIFRLKSNDTVRKGRLRFSLESTSNLDNFNLNSEGYFYFTTKCLDREYQGSFQIKVYDKATMCTKVFSFQVYPNSPPTYSVIEHTSQFYQKSDLLTKIEISDPNHALSELSVCVEENFELTQNGSQVTVRPKESFNLPEGETCFELLISDNGIGPQNKNLMKTKASFCFEYIIPQIDEMNLPESMNVYLHYGDWHYDPQYPDNNHHFQVLSNEVTLIDPKSGLVVWKESSINTFESGHTTAVTYELYLGTFHFKSYQMNLTVRSPPTLKALPTVYGYYGVALEFSVEVDFFNSSMLSFEAENFENFCSPSLQAQTGKVTVKCTAPEQGEQESPKLFLESFRVKASLLDHIYTIFSYSEFAINLRNCSAVSFLSLPDLAGVGSFSLDFGDYVSAELPGLLTVSDKSIGSLPTYDLKGQTLEISESQVSAFLGDSLYKVTGNFEFQVSHTCGSSNVFNFDLVLMKQEPSLDLSGLYCNVGSNCTFALENYLTPNTSLIDKIEIRNVPTYDGLNLMTLAGNNLVWKPLYGVPNSGYISISLAVLRRPVLSTFVIDNIYKHSMQSQKLDSFVAVVDEDFSYDFKTYDFQGLEITCSLESLTPQLENPPALSNKTISWSPVKSELLGSTETASSVTIAIECLNTLNANTLHSLEITLVKKCQISDIPNLVGYAEYEWYSTVQITDENPSLVSLDITKNRPLTMGFKLIEQTASEKVYRIYWTPESVSNETIELTCTKRFENPKFEDLSNSKNFTLAINQDPPQPSISMCDLTVELGVDWVCVIDLSEDVEDCELLAPGIQNISVNKSGNTCEITWLKSGIDQIGLQETETIRFTAYNYYTYTFEEFVLFPNERPVINQLEKTSFRLKYGRVPFELQLNASEKVAWSVSGPEGITISKSGLVRWVSEDQAPELLPTLNVTVSATDSHPYPLSQSVSFNIVMEGTNKIPTVSCPDGNTQEVVVGEKWTWDLDPNPSNDLDEDDSTLTFTLENVPESMIVNGKLIEWTAPNSEPTQRVTVYVTDKLGSQEKCTFELFPNYRPQVASERSFEKLTVNNLENFYYILGIEDQDSFLEELSIELIDAPDGMTVDKYGVIEYSYSRTYYPQINFQVKVTDDHSPPQSFTQNFTLTYAHVNQPPSFKKPTMDRYFPVKQFVIETLEKIQKGTLEIQLEDSDSDLVNVNMKIGDFNPFGFTVTRDPSDISVWHLEWTPQFEVSSSTVKIIAYDDTMEEDFFELVIYSRGRFGGRPFMSNIEDLTVEDYDLAVININYELVYSEFSEVEVILENMVNSGLEVIGKGSLVRKPALIEVQIVETVRVKVCTQECDSKEFTITVETTTTTNYTELEQAYFFEHQAETPVTPKEAHTVLETFESIEYCIVGQPQFGRFEITNSNKLKWTDIEYSFFTSGEGIVRASKDTLSPCQNKTDPKDQSVMFCLGYSCSSYFKSYENMTDEGDEEVSLSKNEPNDYSVYIQGKLATRVESNGTYAKYSLPSGVYGEELKWFIDKGGYDYVYSSSVNRKFSGNNLNIDSFTQTNHYAIPGRVLRFKASEDLSEMKHLSCFVNCNGVAKKGILKIDTGTYCILPEYSIDDTTECKLALCEYETQDIQTCGESPSFYLHKPPGVNSVSPRSGHDEGGYEIVVVLESYLEENSEVYIKVGKLSMLEPLKVKHNQIEFLMPSKVDQNVVDIFVSVTKPFRNWVWVTSFEYLGSCASPGHYCVDDSVESCNLGFKCPGTESLLKKPIPCKPGTYQNETNSTECKDCPRGYMCREDAMEQPEVCEAGFICDKTKTATPLTSCPPGHYCPEGTNTQNLEDYKNYYLTQNAFWSDKSDHWMQRGQGMTGNHYSDAPFIPQCIAATLDKTTKCTENCNYPQVCQENHICTLGAKTNDSQATGIYPRQMECDTSIYKCDEGDAEIFDNKDLCDTGRFCPASTEGYDICEGDDPNCASCKCTKGSICPYQGMYSPEQCPPGSLQPECGGTECKFCPGGYFCPCYETSSEDVLKVTAVHSNETSVSVLNLNREILPSVKEVVLSFYSGNQFLENFTLSTEGIGPIEYSEFVCNHKRKGIVECPKGYECPEGVSRPVPCLPGKYNDKTKASVCKKCPIGNYCPNSAMEDYVECELGQACHQEGMSEGFECLEGYYCLKGTDFYSKSETCNADQNNCPVACSIGHKCPTGSSRETKCTGKFYQDKEAQPNCIKSPNGYIPNKNNTGIDICEEGYFCNHDKEENNLYEFCPEGFYCKQKTEQGNSSVVNPELPSTSSCENIPEGEPIPCPAGHFCVKGSTRPDICPVGTYSDVCGLGRCKPCPEGYRCTEQGTVTPVPCPSGTYRQGAATECVECPEGTWGANKQSKSRLSDCEPCPAGKVCYRAGTYSYEMMRDCYSGFYCEQGTVEEFNMCPDSYFCPTGTKSLEEAKQNLCPKGFYCPEGTSVAEEMLKTCQETLEECLIGVTCPQNSYCPEGTGINYYECPEGTYSDERSSSLFDCKEDPNLPPRIYDMRNVTLNEDLNTTAKVSNENGGLTLSALSYNVFKLNTEFLPEIGNLGDDFHIFIYLEDGTYSYKIPFLEGQSYSPLQRVPLALTYESSILNNKTYEFAIIAHKTVNVKFNIEILNGLFSHEYFQKYFSKALTFEFSEQLLEKKTFLSVLSRQSADYFREPMNLNFHSIVEGGPENYDYYVLSFVNSISISVLDTLPESTQEFFPQQSKTLWGTLHTRQLLYPMDYLPYFTDCSELGAFIPFYKLITHNSCDLVNQTDIVTAQILRPYQKPKGDYCEVDLVCKYAENFDDKSSKQFWTDTSELSNSYLFYITKNQVSDFEYVEAIPDQYTKGNKFSDSYYGTENLVGVQSIRGSEDYKSGDLPRKVELRIGYYQKTQSERQVFLAEVHFKEFDSSSDRTYDFTFVYYALSWKQCLDLFAYEDYTYYIFVGVLCLIILMPVVVYWGINYVFSRVLPRPPLKVRLYLMEAVKGFKGVMMALFPCLVLVCVPVYLFRNSESIKTIPGSYDETQTLEEENSQESVRILQYQNGRTGLVLFLVGWYILYRTSYLMFPSECLTYEDPQELKFQNRRLRGLYLWRVLSVLLFCVAIHQFAKSEVYSEYQFLFIVVFSWIGDKLSGRISSELDDELYAQPLSGGILLTIMIITLQVDKFSDFIIGYMTQIMIKIVKRSFLEPYKLKIQRQVNKLKALLKIKTPDEASTLSFADRQYLEQVIDFSGATVESIATWVFPILVAFNYFFYQELKLSIEKSFLVYFMAFSLMQAVSEIFYGVFFNNALECRTGSLISEKLAELRKLYLNRETKWVMHDKTPHKGKQLMESVHNLMRMGFSSQYFFLVALGMIGVVSVMYGVELWVIWEYNPFKDYLGMGSGVAIVFVCRVFELGVTFVGNKLKVWKLKKQPEQEENLQNEFYEELDYYVRRSLRTGEFYLREDVLNKALAMALNDKYLSEVSDTKRKAELIEFLKKMQSAIALNRKKEPQIELEEVSFMDELNDWSELLTYDWSEAL